jgi:hypothetical protein
MNDLEPRRCVATNRAGEQCRRAPIRGGAVCPMHGGGIPAVKQAAKERLLAMVEPALDVLYRATRSAPPCEHCGRSDADRDPTAVRAAGMILDRAGLSPALAVTLTQEQPAAPYLQWMPHDRLALISEWIAAAKLAMQVGEPPAAWDPPPVADDGVIVEGDDPDDPDALGRSPVGNGPK